MHHFKFEHLVKEMPSYSLYLYFALEFEGLNAQRWILFNLL